MLCLIGRIHDFVFGADDRKSCRMGYGYSVEEAKRFLDSFSPEPGKADDPGRETKQPAESGYLREILLVKQEQDEESSGC